MTVAALGVVAFLVGGLAAFVVGPDDDPDDGVVATATTTSPEPASTVAEPTTTAPPTTIDPNAPPSQQVGSGEPVTFVFGGDIHFDGPLAGTLADDPGSILAGVQPVLQDADVAVVNLETAIGDRGTKASKEFNFQAPPTAFTALMDSGVDVIGMANNHALDYGQDGLLQTFAAAKEMQAPILGIGGNELAAFAPWTSEINGQRVSVIAATSVLDGNLIDDWTATADHPGVASAKRLDSLLAAVRAAREESDTVAVFLHWGTEATTCADDRQLDLAPQLVEAGADIVVGSHAHRVLAGGYVGHAYVDYGLGNLVFKTSSAGGRETGLLRVTATGRRIDQAEWLPGRIGTDFLPQLLTGPDQEEELAEWNELRACSQLADAPSS